MIREPVHAALFALLSQSSKFITASRRVKHWADVPSAADQPALFLSSRGQVATVRQPGMPPIWDLAFDAIVYVKTTGEPDLSPATLMNPLLDAIEAAMAPDNFATRKLTLGGLVEHCWIEGEITTDEGVLGDQGVALIPILVRVV